MYKMIDNDFVVVAENLGKIYGDGGTVRALDGVNLKIRRGEMLAVMGPSGSGKSTLLNILGALDLPSSGTISVAGQDISQMKDLDGFRSKTVGFVFQLHNLIPTLTTLENVEIPLYEEKIDTASRRKRAEKLLRVVGLSDRKDHLPNQMSGGQRQRAAIARALANNPAIILADEPTGNLDSKSTDEIMQLLRQLNREQGTTIIVVTHNPAVARFANRIITVRDGKILRDERVENVYLEDLKEFMDTALGHKLQEGVVPTEVSGLGLEKMAEPAKQLPKKVK